MDSPRLLRLAAVVAALGLAGCAEEPVVPTVVFRLYGPPAPLPEGGCPAPAIGPSRPPVGGDANRLRLTYRAAGGGPLLCDAVVPLDQPLPVVAVPDGAGGATRVDLHAELFRVNAGSVVLVSSGSALDVNLAAAEVAVQVTPSEAFSCAPAPAAVGRAFHSATLLPTGEVLLVGGLVAATDGATVDPDVAAGDLYATDRVEIVDPVGGASRELLVTGLLPRALHAAFLLDRKPSEPIRIALVGGTTVAGDALVTPVVRPATGTEPFALMPTDAALPAPTEILTYDPIADTITRELVPVASAVAPRLFSALATSPGVVAGGWSDPTRATEVATFEALDSTSAVSAAVGSLVTPRFGASLTPLPDGRLLAWGGVLATESPGPQGELVDPALETSAPLPFAGTARTPTLRALHAAVAVGDGEVLVVGGLAVVGGRALDPATPLAERILLGPPADSIEVPAPAAAQPVAGAGVTSLAGGGVLVCGGHPAPDSPDCAVGAGLRCATGAALRYRSAALTAVGSMVVARFGHRAVALADGGVLVTGGLAPRDGGLGLLHDLERFNPATAADDPIRDLAPDVARAPADVARTLDGRPAAPCTLLAP